MNSLFNALKGQVNTLNAILALCLIALVLYKYRRYRAAKILMISAIVVFLLTSTAYLPGYLTRKLESSYAYFNIENYPFKNDTVYIHSLGGGYTFDIELGPQAQLSGSSLGRLSEAIRITRLLPNGMLVVSGDTSSGDQSLASVMKKAAVELGIDSARIRMLSSPSTTEEEAEAFVKTFGTERKVIVVTDAVHMRRAMSLFRKKGAKAIAAPTNFLIKTDHDPFALRWWPSVKNMLLMDRIWREVFGSIKSTLFN